MMMMMMMMMMRLMMMMMIMRSYGRLIFYSGSDFLSRFSAPPLSQHPDSERSLCRIETFNPEQTRPRQQITDQ